MSLFELSCLLGLPHSCSVPTTLWGLHVSSMGRIEHLQLQSFIHSVIHSYVQPVFTSTYHVPGAGDTLMNKKDQKPCPVGRWFWRKFDDLSVSSFSRAGMVWLAHEVWSVMHVAALGPKAPSKWLFRASGLIISLPFFLVHLGAPQIFWSSFPGQGSAGGFLLPDG